MGEFCFFVIPAHAGIQGICLSLFVFRRHFRFIEEKPNAAASTSPSALDFGMRRNDDQNRTASSCATVFPSTSP